MYHAGRLCTVCCLWFQSLSYLRFSPLPSSAFSLLSVQQAAFFLSILWHLDLAKMQHFCFARWFCWWWLIELGKTEICISYFCKHEMGEEEEGIQKQPLLKRWKRLPRNPVLLSVFKLWLQETRVHIQGEILHEPTSGF